MNILRDIQQCVYDTGRTEICLCYRTDRNVSMLADGQKCDYATGRTQICLW